jgi:excisionase family DNA binding protein
MTLHELAEETGVSYDTLKKAVQQDRLAAEKSGHIWLSTRAAVEESQEAGRLRRR